MKLSELFPNHKYRYLSNGKSVSSIKKRDDLIAEGYDAYFTVNGFQDDNHTKEGLTNLNAFFVDIDTELTEEGIEEIKKILDPTLIVKTGKGYHFYWVLDEALFKEEYIPYDWEHEIVPRWEMIEKSLVLHLGGDLAVKDVARILRMPNSVYFKEWWKTHTEAPTDEEIKKLPKVKAIYKNEAARYTMEEVFEVFPKLEEEKDIKKTKEEKVVVEGSRPGDAFNQKATWEEILEGKGWKKARVLGEVAYWSRPEKKGGISATTEFYKGYFYVFTSSVAGLEAGKAYTKFSTYTHLYHGGDFKKSAGAVAKAYSIAPKSQKGLGGDHAVAPVVHSAQEVHEEEEKVVTMSLEMFEGLQVSRKKHQRGMQQLAKQALTAEPEKVEALTKDIEKIQKKVDAIEAKIVKAYEYQMKKEYPNIMRRAETEVYYDYKDGVYAEIQRTDLINYIVNSLEAEGLDKFKAEGVYRTILTNFHRFMELFEETQDANIINVKNGLYYIKEKELRPHVPTYRALSRCEVDYDPTAQCPLWQKSILDWTMGDCMSEKALMLQEFAGYCFYDSVEFQKALFLFGDGGNGKSVFVSMLMKILGKNAFGALSLDQINSRFGNSAVVGLRVNVINEVSNRYYQTDNMKKLISGDEIQVEKKNKGFFTYAPRIKFFFLVNEMPKMDDYSDAMNRRMMIIRFDNKFREELGNIDFRLKEKLYNESAGIFNWALEGLYRLLEQGKFTDSEENKREKHEYKKENSVIQSFFEDHVHQYTGGSLTTTEMYQYYIGFCNAEGQKIKMKKWAVTKWIKKALSDNKETFSNVSFENRKYGKADACFLNIDIHDKDMLKKAFRRDQGFSDDITMNDMHASHDF
jgi:P4 family phage/plasmid primase-like protien